MTPESRRTLKYKRRRIAPSPGPSRVPREVDLGGSREAGSGLVPSLHILHVPGAS